MTKKEFIQKISTSPLSKYVINLEGILRNTIRLYLTKQDESNLAIGASKIGGRPDLPADTIWPTESNAIPLSFIAQLNLKEVFAYDSQRVLPESGMLYFFYQAKQDAWGFDPKDKDKFKVVYYECAIDSLQRRDYPENMLEEGRFESNAIRFAREVSLPSYQSGLLSFMTEEERDQFFELFPPEGTINKMLGYADEVQNEMELECELVTNGLYCGDAAGYQDPRRPDLEKNKGEWQLLLQVDSNDEAGMMWGDMGRLYYWIKKSDLKARRFENSWFILQCS